MNNENKIDEALMEFVAEGEEILQRVSLSLQQIEKEKRNPELIGGVYRDMHTLKGTAQLFGFQEIGKLAHAMEASMDPIRKLNLEIPARLLDASFKGLDLLDRMLKSVRESQKDTGYDAEVLRLVTQLADAATAQFHAEINTTQDLNASVETSSHWVEAIGDTGKLTKAIHQMNEPGNSVFESRDAAEESKKLALARAEFLEIKEHFYHSHFRGIEENQEVVRAFNGAIQKAEEGWVLGREVLNEFKSGQVQKASTLMSKMDKKLFEASEHLDALNHELILMEQAELKGAWSKASRGQKIGLSIGVFFVGLMVFAAFLGKAIDSRVSTLEKEKVTKEKELEAFENAIKQHAIVSQTDVSGKITYANDRFVKVSGYTREELIGQNHRLLNSGVHPKEFFLEMWKAITAGKTWRGRVCNKSKDGSLYWVDSTISPIMDENHRVKGYLSVRYDVSEEVKLAERREKERAVKIHSAKMISLGEMSAGVAHEINNPLAIITGSILIAKKSLSNPAKVEEKLDLIQKSAERISKIVRGLKKFSRSHESKTFTDHNLSLAISEIETMIAPTAFRNQVNLTFEAQPDLWVRCDDLEIEQVIINLVGNAIDAAKATSQKWVKVQVRGEGTQVVIRVIDSGSGIPEDKLPKIFEPFFTTKPAGEGTGLGLSISKGIIEDHGGTIQATQHEGHT